MPEQSNAVLNELSKLSGQLAQRDEHTSHSFDSLHQRLDDLRDEVKSLKYLITGDGSPEKGVLIRLDRIEQDNARRVWWMRACISACISAVIATVAGLIKQMTKP